MNFIISTFETLGWHIEIDRFDDDTPYGRKTFNNVIATKDIHAQKRLVLAAHYDSKYFKDFEFIGATDSSVPCGILVDIAKTLNSALEQQIAMNDRFTTLQMIFFDGEEAFVDWSDNDSLYGARHLASKWENTMVSMASSGNNMIWDGTGGEYTNPLKQMDVFILLDLLGVSDSQIPNMHPETSWMYDRLVDIQKRLARWKLVSDTLQKRVINGQGIFTPGLSAYGPMAIADDHVPFYNRGVPILHCIAVPFPAVWHTIHDNADALSQETILDLALIFRMLVVEYLALDQYMQ